jgi:hypothetical protein
MSTTPDITTSVGSANADQQASDKGKVASQKQNNYRRRGQKQKFAAMTITTMKFEGKCDDLSGYIYDCADPKHRLRTCTRVPRRKSQSTLGAPTRTGAT